MNPHIHQFYRSYALLIARILIGSVFFVAGFSKILDIDGTSAFISAANIPTPSFVAWVLGLLEMGASVGVFLGLYIERAAVVLILTTLFMTVTLYDPSTWATQPFKHIIFLDNLTIMGGLLFVVAHGLGQSWGLGKRYDRDDGLVQKNSR
jgi:putative oxidoreductase